MRDFEVAPYFDRRRAAVLVRCDDCRGGWIRRLRTLSTFAFYKNRPRVAVTAGINPPGWSPKMWCRLVQFIDSHGWEAASHTMSHPWLTRIDAQEVRGELEVSRDVIINELSRAGLSPTGVPTFVYPYGDYGPREIDLLRQTGYTLALTYRTEEGVVEIPQGDALYEWGYTLNAPETLTFEEMRERFQSVYRSGEVFSVTTHPPVVRPDRRLRAPNIYRANGSWARLLDHMCSIPDVWFTTFGALAAYRAQTDTVEIRSKGDGIDVSYEPAEFPLPHVPLSISFTSTNRPNSVLLNDDPLPHLESPGDLPSKGWRFDAGRVVVSLHSPGTLTVT